MIKKVNPMAISMALEGLLLKADLELEKEFNDWPEDPDGVEVSWVDFKNHYDSLVFALRASVESLLGDLPVVVIPEEPFMPISIPAEKEQGKYHGRHNGDRPMWYFSRPMKDYPQKFSVVIDGCYNVTVDGHDGNRFVVGSTIIKQSDVKGRGMAVVTGANCRSTTCHIIIERKEPVEPRSYSTIDIIKNLRFLHNKAFTWLPYTGAAYGRSAKFVWPELGEEFFVPDMSKDYSPRGGNHRTYFCGTNNAPEVSNRTRASIFGPAGKKASFVEIHYS